MPDSPVPAYWLYGERRESQLPDVLHIETIEARSSIYDWNIQAHRHHGMYQFLLIETGGGRTRIDGLFHDLFPGTAIVLPPLVVHEFSFKPGTNGFVTSVDGGALKTLLDSEPHASAALSRPVVLKRRRSDQQTKALGAILRSALAEFSASRTAREPALSAYAELIAIWFARASQIQAADDAVAKHPRSDLIRRFIEMVETSYQKHMALTGYARALGVSVPHLTRTCRQVIGRSAAQVVQDRLMIEARRDLVYSAMPISQIAFRLGFSDPAYFSRFFTARAGVSPSAYRANG
ncbi:MAG: helix-turn-helix domain-containing protein [Rhodospirillales bacterium]|nr:helix-turn-helix domain-containing protein [Rhodospirillales bacterium]